MDSDISVFLVAAEKSLLPFGILLAFWPAVYLLSAAFGVDLRKQYHALFGSAVIAYLWTASGSSAVLALFTSVAALATREFRNRLIRFWRELSGDSNLNSYLSELRNVLQEDGRMDHKTKKELEKMAGEGFDQFSSIWISASIGLVVFSTYYRFTVFLYE